MNATLKTLQVASATEPQKLAGAIAYAVRSDGAVELRAIGAGAVNQAVKAITIARGYLIQAGIDIACVPAFRDIEIDANERTAIILTVMPLVDMAAVYRKAVGA